MLTGPFWGINMNIRQQRYIWVFISTLNGLICAGTAPAETRVAVLDFELNDLAGITPTPKEELARTASLGPLLRDALSSKPGYRLIEIGPDKQAKANRGFGYLFDHADEAADLGRKVNADIVVVGRIHKPSFLFAYLKARLVRVSNRTPIKELVVEVKGNATKVTERGIARMADQIDQALRGNSIPDATWHAQRPCSSPFSIMAKTPCHTLAPALPHCLEQQYAGGHGKVEAFHLAKHRDLDQKIAGFAGQASHALALRAHHQRQG